MTSPDRYAPDGSYNADTIRQLQNAAMEAYKEQTKAQVFGPFVESRNHLFKDFIENIANALGGNAAPAFQPIADGQLALRERLDLLDGVRGYCAAYQTRNINAAWSYGDNRRRDLPFAAPYGPSKGAHVDAAKGGIVFDEAGLWTVHVMIHARSTGYAAGGFGEPDAVAMYIRIHRPDGSIDTETVVDAYSRDEVTSVPATLPFVIPEPGYYVTIGCWTSRWRWWDGGTRYTRLAAVMNDNRTVNPGEETVPDE